MSTAVAKGVSTLPRFVIARPLDAVPAHITVEAVLSYAQRRGVGRRSDAYMEGLKAKLGFVLHGKAMGATYSEGTAEFDAYWSGAYYARSYIESVIRESERTP